MLFRSYNVSSEKFDQDMTHFFNFPNDEFTSDSVNRIVSEQEIMKHADDSILSSYYHIYLQELRSRVQFTPVSFNPDALNIALHIRSYTKTDCDPNPRRELYNPQRLPFYQNIVKHLSSIDRPKEFHIFSQEPIQDLDLGVDLKFHVSEYPSITLSHLMLADVLVTSNSSFSYIAHLFNDNVCLGRPNFFHRWKDKTIHLDMFGNFSSLEIQ